MRKIRYEKRIKQKKYKSGALASVFLYTKGKKKEASKQRNKSNYLTIYRKNSTHMLWGIENGGKNIGIGSESKLFSNKKTEINYVVL